MIREPVIVLRKALCKKKGRARWRICPDKTLTLDDIGEACQCLMYALAVDSDLGFEKTLEELTSGCMNSAITGRSVFKPVDWYFNAGQDDQSSDPD